MYELLLLLAGGFLALKLYDKGVIAGRIAKASEVQAYNEGAKDVFESLGDDEGEHDELPFDEPQPEPPPTRH